MEKSSSSDAESCCFCCSGAVPAVSLRQTSNNEEAERGVLGSWKWVTHRESTPRTTERRYWSCENWRKRKGTRAWVVYPAALARRSVGSEIHYGRLYGRTRRWKTTSERVRWAGPPHTEGCRHENLARKHETSTKSHMPELEAFSHLQSKLVTSNLALERPVVTSKLLNQAFLSFPTYVRSRPGACMARAAISTPFLSVVLLLSAAAQIGRCGTSTATKSHFVEVTAVGCECRISP